MTDRYLELLLGGGVGDGSALLPDIDLGVRDAAARLSARLPRLHPSFRFEERLAGRLLETGSAMRRSAVVGEEGVVVSLLDRRGGGIVMIDDPSFDPLAAGPLGPDRTHLVRPLLIGGAITSAALSIAGAAFVAWRRTRPRDRAMVRAARAASRTRLA